MMKDKLLYCVFLLICTLSFAQQAGTYTFNWEDNKKTSVGGRAVSMPLFQQENMGYNAGSKTLYFNMSLPVTGPVDENSLQISDVVYETVTVQQLGDLSVAALPVGLNAVIKASHARNDWFAVIRLSPIIKEGTGYKRVKSFRYSYSLGRAGQAQRNASQANAVTSSVLATGEWFRFYVEKSGVYKLSKSFLQGLGLNVNADPRRIKIYGNGGRMLPLLNSVDYPIDLAENAITFVGEEDGAFNDGDYILFYAEGVDNWSAENGTHNNLYADRSYYYVTSAGGNGKRIQNLQQPAGTPSLTVTSFDEYRFHERDLISVGRLGRKWHGEAFNVNNEQDFEFTIPDIDSPVSVTVSAAANAVSTTSLAVQVNGQALGTASFPPPPTHHAGVERTINGTATSGGAAITVTLTYNNNGVPGSNAWLDYIILRAKRKLRGNGQQFRFRINDAANNIGVAEYQVSNAAGISQVWDITDIYNATKVNNTAQNQFSFKGPLGEVRQYIAVVPDDFYAPLRESNARVANQDLKGTIFRNGQGQFQDVDYIIVTPQFLNGVAEKLANFHRTSSQLNVKVVNLETIYQEFASGKQDIGAIRNFVKYVYDNASSPENKIKYLNLFGDTSFDFKNRIPNNTNIVPTFHAYDPSGSLNFNDVLTFMSDDFFVLMDPDEGRLLMNGGGFEGPDVAVGRMLVSSTAQADQMVNKVIEYKSEEAYGRWRNEYVIIADDVDEPGIDDDFVPQQENVVNNIMAQRPFVNIRKIYADSYVQQASAGGNRYPEAKDQIVRAINFGTLVVNYLGHGGEDFITSERIFERADADNLNNRFKYPLFITATCELTRFDNPYRPTAGESIFWNPAGGAIAMITTTRSIFVNSAFNFNRILTTKLYALEQGEIVQYPSMAEAMRQTKAQTGDTGFRVIAFVGDPALMLAIPKPKVVLTTINNVPVGASTEVLQSLSFVTLGGEVTDENENLLSNYNGEVAVSVFDKPVSRLTLGNDNPTPIYNFNVLGETIFRGNATVTNGKFEFGFVVPRDIRIPVSEGRVSFYAKRNNILEDQTGFNTVIRIGGINPNAAVDNTGPKVRLYMNDESFISGGITNESPIFLAYLEDENGINTASGIGHDIVAILDGDETNPYILNDYYETELDDYTRGKVRFPFSNLAKGLHTITFKAWDVYNNLVTAEIQFIVVGDEEMYIEKVLNYPNPFVSYTEFWFTHNRPFEPLDVQVQVFTITGKVVRTINQSVVTDGFLCRDIKWDGRDDFGDRIGKGVYVYKLTVRSSTTNKRAEKYEKLVLL